MAIAGRPVVTIETLTKQLLPETRHLKRKLDAEQRRYDELWKMQYDGRPERDPLFRLEERTVLQRGLPIQTQRSVLGPMWQRYHQKFAAEQEQQQRDAAVVAAQRSPRPGAANMVSTLLNAARRLGSPDPISGQRVPGRDKGAGCER